jgi:hypothetical protein
VGAPALRSRAQLARRVRPRPRFGHSLTRSLGHSGPRSVTRALAWPLAHALAPRRRSSLESACAELAEELGLVLPSADVAAGLCATLPSTISGATRTARFVCKEYQVRVRSVGDRAGVTLAAVVTLPRW